MSWLCSTSTAIATSLIRTARKARETPWTGDMLPLLWLLVSCVPHYGHAASFGLAQRVSTLQSSALSGVSGLAASRTHPGVYYAHNDYGGSNKVFAIDTKTGNLQATFTISGATNGDWEDIAVGPCPVGGSCIYIGDIGRGHGSPRNVVYRVREPSVIQDQSLPILDQLHFRWNQPDAECLMVDPSGNTYIISRAVGMGVMAKLPFFGWGGQTVDIGATQHLSIRTTHHDPLACDISPSGTDMLIKAKKAVYYYAVKGRDYFAAVRGSAETVTYHYEHLGESIAWTPTGDGFYTVAEGKNAPIYLYKKTSASSSTVSVTHTAAFSAPQRQGSIQTNTVTEASGLAASREHPGVYYSHNDSGDSNRIFAMDPKTGQVLAVLTISGATNGDWEDIAVGPCPMGHCIYIGDIGRGHGAPRNVIYRVREPTVIHDQIVPVLDKVQYSWGEPESECLMVDPKGNAFLISRRSGMGMMAKIPNTSFGGGTVHLTYLQAISASTGHHDPLGCDISPDGSEILIRAKEDIYYYVVSGQDYFSAVQGHFLTFPYHVETWGEGIAWTATADGFYTVAEGSHVPFYFNRRLSASDLTTTSVPSSTMPTNIIHGPRFAPGRMVSTIDSVEINKASGLAASRTHPGIYYTHNGHGDSNRIFAVEATSGRLLATLTITGARNGDWEDIAIGPCPGRGFCIYIGDIGGTGGPARNVIYMVKEPTSIKDQSLPFVDQLYFSWDESDAQCLMVDPSGNVYILSRGPSGDVVSKLPPTAWAASTTTVASSSSHHLPSSPFRQDSRGCDISHDGTEMLVKTLDNVYYYNVTNGDYVSRLNGPAANVSYHHESSGQAIAWTPSSDGYYTLGQGYFLPLYFYKRE